MGFFILDHCEQAEAVQSVIHAEAEKRRKERENFHITSVPVLVRAAHEPSLYNGSSEDHEEGTAWIVKLICIILSQISLTYLGVIRKISYSQKLP